MGGLWNTILLYPYGVLGTLIRHSTPNAGRLKLLYPIHEPRLTKGARHARYIIMHVCTKLPAARWPSAPSPPLLLIRVSPRSWPAPPPSPVKREGLQQTQSRHTRSSSLPPSDARARHIDGAHEWEAASRPAGRRACDPGGGGGGGGHATIQGHIVSRRVVQQMGSAGAWRRADAVSTTVPGACSA